MRCCRNPVALELEFGDLRPCDRPTRCVTFRRPYAISARGNHMLQSARRDVSGRSWLGILRLGDLASGVIARRAALTPRTRRCRRVRQPGARAARASDWDSAMRPAGNRSSSPPRIRQQMLPWRPSAIARACCRVGSETREKPWRDQAIGCGVLREPHVAVDRSAMIRGEMFGLGRGNSCRRSRRMMSPMRCPTCRKPGEPSAEGNRGRSRSRFRQRYSSRPVRGGLRSAVVAIAAG